jgi:hypothetical protein
MSYALRITASHALFQAADNTAVMTDVRPAQRGVVSGMPGLSRNLGLISGASVMGAVFALASSTTNSTTAHPGAVAAGMRVTFAVAGILIVVAIGVAVRARLASRYGQLGAGGRGLGFPVPRLETPHACEDTR